MIDTIYLNVYHYLRSLNSIRTTERFCTSICKLVWSVVTQSSFSMLVELDSRVCLSEYLYFLPSSHPHSFPLSPFPSHPHSFPLSPFPSSCRSHPRAVHLPLRAVRPGVGGDVGQSPVLFASQLDGGCRLFRVFCPGLRTRNELGKRNR